MAGSTSNWFKTGSGPKARAIYLSPAQQQGLGGRAAIMTQLGGRGANSIIAMHSPPSGVAKTRKTTTPGGDHTFGFGKHRGLTVDQVAQKDPGYFAWMQKNLSSVRPGSAQEQAMQAIGQYQAAKTGNAQPAGAPAPAPTTPAPAAAVAAPTPAPAPAPVKPPPSVQGKSSVGDDVSYGARDQHQGTLIAKHAGGTHGVVRDAGTGQYQVVNLATGVPVGRPYDTKGGATRRMNSEAPAPTPAPVAAPATAAPAPTSTRPGAPGPGKASPPAAWYPPDVAASLPEFHVRQYKDSKTRTAAVVSQVAKAGTTYTSDETDAIKSYQDGVDWGDIRRPAPARTGQGLYQPINRLMRNIPEHDRVWQTPHAITVIKERIKQMRDVMKKSRTPEDLITFRGIRADGDRNGMFKKLFRTWKSQVYDKWEVGKTYTKGHALVDPAFGSTTMSKSVAEKDFVTSSYGTTEGGLVEYRLPKGTPAIIMNHANPTSGYAHTAEVLLAEGRSYRVLAKWTDPNGLSRAVLEILPD